MGMGFSIPSSVAVIDLDSNGYADKMYVGDMGGQMLRFGRFTEDDGATALDFPDTNENVNDWYAHTLFDTADTRKIFYAPSVTLERGHDLVFFGTGDRNDACNPATDDRIYAVMDDHSDYTVDDLDLVDITDPAAAPPTFTSDKGYYLQLGPGEKVLAEGMVFNKVYYISSFDPNNSDPCKPGGLSRLYAFEYKTGVAVIDFDGDGQPERSTEIGGGIPSKPVMIIPSDGTSKLLISVGSTNADVASEGVSAGIVSIDPLLPSRNFFYQWWSDL
jgi:type IV pilus assembly protein PilY1